MAILAGQRLTAQVWYDNSPHQIAGGYAAITSNFPSSGFATSEAVYLTSSSMTLRNGRAYRITVNGLFNGATAGNTARVFVKRNTVGGTSLFDTQAIALPAASTNYRETYENEAANQTGADIVTTLVVTIQQRSGTGGVAVAASATSPACLRVEDVGAATDYPNATPIT